MLKEVKEKEMGEKYLNEFLKGLYEFCKSFNEEEKERLMKKELMFGKNVLFKWF